MARARTIVVSLLALGAIGGALILAQDGDLGPSLPFTATAPTQTASTSAGGETAAPGGLAPMFGDMADLVERVTPAVVNIQVKAAAEAQELPPILQDPRFRRFFGVPDQAPQQRERSAVGSGVIVDAKQGYVLTNFHVVDKATDIAVTLKDRRSFTAKVVGKDQATDLALLKIEATDLIALPLGDSRALRAGDFVLAIGNPFGLGQTVTSGIVSALGRTGFIDQGYEDFIQTDAAINPGNSGGALINLKGELVGTPTVIIGPGGNIGVGFAVPTSIAASVMDQIIQSGDVTRGRIGVGIQDVTPEVAQNLGLDVTHGALVNSVEPDAPADDAGVKAGDVVVALNGTDIEGSGSLRNRVAFTKPGDKVKLSIVRDGEKRDIDVTVAKLDTSKQTAQAPEPPVQSQIMGAIFENSSDGVRVRDVEDNSPAAAIGLQAGDIIAAVNRNGVKTTAQLEKALESSKGQAVLFIKRDGRDVVVIVP